jgi:DNA-binding SARP family transcriptional activator
LEVVDAEQSLGGSQQRLVLALLLLSSPEALSADRLVDELWGERPPASAQHAVQVYVSAIRKLLRSSDEVAVRTTPAGYVIDVAPELIDARRFERLLGDAQDALADDPPRARTLFEEALALWRGPPLAECVESELARLEADRLDELHTLAAEGVAEAGLACGEHGELIGAIRALVSANPLRERPRRLLMLALYRSGRHAEALSAYRDTCAALDEIGLQPGPELRELEAAILRHDESLRAVTGAGSGPSARGDDGAPIPLPPRLQEMPATGFVGRSRERGRLGELFREASEGNRRLVLVSGEPGIGKTRLSTHAAFDARSEGAIVLYGRADEELAIPYAPWVEALAHYFEHAPEAVLCAHAERYGGELARLIPQLTERLAEVPPPRATDPDTERYLLWGAVVGLLREASGDEPLVLVLDDLHWADKPTLQLLKHLVSQGQGLRGLIIATYRESDLARGHPLTDALADLHREQGVERIALKGIGEEDVVEIMERAAGHELDEAGRGLAKDLFRETDGNPFYTGELLRHLRESGAIYQLDGGHWTLRGALSELGLPASVREVLGRRVERLGEEARKALSIAAVIGRDFDVELLRRVSERSEEELLELLEEAVAASVLVESTSVPGRFSFAHALINHTLYEDLGTTRRARLHRRVGEALEELVGAERGARAPELAHHWTKATAAVDLHKAATYARMAGERALAELAPDEAERWFSQALELQGQETEADPTERCELLIGLGEAQRQSGDAAYRETLLEASRIACALGDAELAASAALANNRGNSSVVGELDVERMAAIERALELDDPPQAARRARLLALEAIELTWDPDFARRTALADEAVSLARGAGNPRTLAEVIHLAIFAYWSAETLELRAALTGELSRCASSLPDPALHFWVHSDGCQVLIERGDFARARAVLERERQIAEELGQPMLKWVATSVRAGWALLHGDLTGAEPLVERSFQIGQEGGQPDAVFFYGGLLAHIRTFQGRGQEIVAMLEQSVSAYPAIAAWKAALAQILGWLGRGAESAAILEDAASDRFEHVSPSPARSTALVLYAEAAVLTGNAGAAAILYELIEPWAEQIVWNGSTGYGHARMWLGLLAAVIRRREQAEQHLQFSCEFHKANEMPLWEARGHLGWAQALADGGEAGPAREHAARALDLSRANGYGLFVEPAAALLEAEPAAQA